MGVGACRRRGGGSRGAAAAPAAPAARQTPPLSAQVTAATRELRTAGAPGPDRLEKSPGLKNLGMAPRYFDGLPFFGHELLISTNKHPGSTNQIKKRMSATCQRISADPRRHVREA